MKNLTLLLLAFLAISVISCNKGVSKDGESTSASACIDDAILHVKLGDNRTQVGEKLTSQGYNWKDDNTFVTVTETFKYNDKYFSQAVFTFFDAKVWFSEVRNTFYNEKEALDAFKEYDTYFNTKYSNFKTTKTNNVCQKYSEYNDKMTSLSIMLIHNDKEDVPELLQDEETLKNAKEHWDVSISINKSGTI